MQAADINRILAARPRRTGRVFIAGLLLGFDVGLLLIWVLWFAAFLQGSNGQMTIGGVALPVAYGLLLGPLAIASLIAVWLISNLRAYPVVLGIAVVWLAYAWLGVAIGALALGMLQFSRVAIVCLLVSGRPAFRQ
jgi:hypothetical protein